MLKIMHKEIDISHSPILFNMPITAENFSRYWEVHSGEWWVENGWLAGRNPGNFPGMIFLSGNFPGNVLVDFKARTVPPCTHDINFMWNGSWDTKQNQRGIAYVAGLEGWWEGKVGIEKSPEYKLNAGTPLLDFQPGKLYHIQGGSIDGHCFVFVDGNPVLELTDPDPIDSQQFSKVGFEAYCSHIQIQQVEIRSVVWKEIHEHYEPEF